MFLRLEINGLIPEIEKIKKVLSTAPIRGFPKGITKRRRGLKELWFLAKVLSLFYMAYRKTQILVLN